MKYVYVNAEGKRIHLQVRSCIDGVTVLEETKNKPVVISAEKWVSDIMQYIESTGNRPEIAVFHVFENYGQTYRNKNGYERSPIPKKMLQSCVAYFELLRKDSLAELEDSAWADNKPFTSKMVLDIFETTVAT
jgi:hypothetical protein